LFAQTLRGFIEIEKSCFRVDTKNYTYLNKTLNDQNMMISHNENLKSSNQQILFDFSFTDKLERLQR